LKQTKKSEQERRKRENEHEECRGKHERGIDRENGFLDKRNV
jgi:hypothetical protein